MAPWLLNSPGALYYLRPVIDPVLTIALPFSSAKPGASQVKVTIDISLESAVPLLVSNILQTLLMLLEARIVDQQIKFVEGSQSLFDSMIAKLRFAHIARNQQSPSTSFRLRVQFLRRRLALRAVK